MSLRSMLVVMLVIFPVLLFGQSEVINGFESAEMNADTSYWGYEISEHALDSLSYVDISYINSPVSEGDSSMKLEYSAHNIEGWGGYAKCEHYHPDSNSVYDWSAYDSISFDYYIETPQTLTGRVELRFNIYEVSNSENGNKTYSVHEVEHYYSFHKILDGAPGWNRATLILDRTDSWDGTGYTLTPEPWSGILGNQKFNKDKIKGFSFEFSISGDGAGDHSKGVIIIDQIALRGLQGIDFIIFNGKTVPGNLSQFTWGQSTLEIEENAGATEDTHALKWTQGDEWGNGWSGAGWNINPAANLVGSWSKDTLHFKMKAPAGTGALRVQFEDGTAKVGQSFTPAGDDAWHDYAFKLSEMPYWDETSNIDSSAITSFQIMGEGTAIAGTVIYLDDVWTGDPIIDIKPTGEVENFAAVPVPANYFNIISWTDFDEEENEQYFVYASPQPITDVDNPIVDHLGKFPKGEQSALHYLHYPLQDKENTYYYAIQCLDAFGNMGPLTSAGPVTNTAKGIATISLNPPLNFVADGDVQEWENSTIMPFTLSKSTAFISRGEFTDDADMTATVYLAIDNEYLYVAVSNLEDNYSFDPAGNWWEQDVFEMFIGLYDAHGPKHSGFERGQEPDFKIILKENGMAREPSMKVFPDSAAGEPIFCFENWGGGEYVYEAKIPFDSLKLDDDVIFTPENGMRIPIELTIHDNDFGTSEGNLVLSNTNTDNAWQTPTVWSYTWIGDTTATSIGNAGYRVLASYSLEQNYPNPFNPLTTIEYSLAKASLVELSVYNVLGQKIQTLVNTVKSAGIHRISMDASDLATGVYFYRIQAGEFIQIRKMLLVK